MIKHQEKYNPNSSLFSRLQWNCGNWTHPGEPGDGSWKCSYTHPEKAKDEKKDLRTPGYKSAQAPHHSQNSYSHLENKLRRENANKWNWFLSCLGLDQVGGFTIIQQDFSPKSSSHPTSCTRDLGLKEREMVTSWSCLRRWEQKKGKRKVNTLLHAYTKLNIQVDKDKSKLQQWCLHAY